MAPDDPDRRAFSTAGDASTPHELAATIRHLVEGLRDHLTASSVEHAQALAESTAAAATRFGAALDGTAEENRAALDVAAQDLRQVAEALAARVEEAVGADGARFTAAAVDAETRLSAAAADLVTRLEAAADAYGGVVDDQTEALSTQVAAARGEIRDGLAGSTEAITELIIGAVEDAAKALQEVAEQTARDVGASTDQLLTPTASLLADVHGAAESTQVSAAALQDTAAALEGSAAVLDGVAASHDQVTQRITELLDRVDGPVADHLAEISEGFSTQTQAALDAAAATITSVGGDAIERLSLDLVALTDRLESASDRTAATIDSVAERSAQTTTAGLADALGNAVDVLTEQADELTARLARATEAAATAVQAGAAQAEETLGEARETADVGRAAASTLSVTVGQLIDEVQAIAGLVTELERRMGVETAQLITATETSADRLGRLSDVATGRLVSDVGELMGRVQTDLVSVADGMGEALADAVGRIRGATEVVDGRVEQHGKALVGTADSLRDIERSLELAGAEMTDHADRLDRAAEEFTARTRETGDRLVATADTMADRIGEAADAALTVHGQQVQASSEQMSTTVTWAGRTVQQTVEGLLDDLGATVRIALGRISDAGDQARDQLLSAVTDADQQLATRVDHSLAPLTVETRRIAEQQAVMAETIARAETMMGQREAESARRDEVAVRMESAISDAADLVTRAVRLRKDEEDSAIERAGAVTDRMADGAERVDALLERVDRVAGRLEAATDAADASREKLEALVVRAEEVAAAAEARRRRAAPVPPPSAER